MITFSEVSKQLDQFRLKEISFELPEGYICGLVGPNGSGKTSLLHLLLGLYQADTGQIRIDGMEYPDSEKSIRALTGTVLVEPLFSAGLTAEQNGRRYGKFYESFQPEAYHAYLEQFHISPRGRFLNLSKGEKLKCQFAFALSCQPKYLILDEPTANFDPDFREAFWKLLGDFVMDGAHSVLLATHLTDDLDRMADHLIYMEHGSLVYAGDIESFREQYRIVSGEAYKLKLIPAKNVIHMEEKPYGAKALVRHHHTDHYAAGLETTYPSIEEFMYFYCQRTGVKGA